MQSFSKNFIYFVFSVFFIAYFVCQREITQSIQSATLQSIKNEDATIAYINNIDLTQVPPKGSPPNLPSTRASEEEKKVEKIRSIHGYGGKGDKAHLGGFTEVDIQGISPHTWRSMMEYFGVKSLLDVGCGRSFSTSWFYLQGVKVQCVEGSRDAIERNLLLSLVDEKSLEKIIVEHDFSLGPWWPEETVDAVWCVELIEHIGRNFQKNYLTAFKKAAFIFVTHSNWGGWHHTEVHNDLWWISRFQMYGFVYSEKLTEKVKTVARKERQNGIPFPVYNKTYNPQHISNTMMVFINPAVASRPEHAHMLSEPGCYNNRPGYNKHCGEENNRNSRKVNTPIPEEFKFIPYKEDVHYKWEDLVKKSVH